jgi:hypothetical protein
MENEGVWETFDALYRTVNRQGRVIAEIEDRIAALEAKLAAHEGRIEHLEGVEQLLEEVA